jgi:hypothetical protein
VELELVPVAPARVRSAVAAAVTKAGVLLDLPSPNRASAWWRAGLDEGVEREPVAARAGYALSPRSTRGAMRA